MATPLEPERDYYWENGRMVLTEGYLRRRGTCCGNGCRHCPYGKAPQPAPINSVPDSSDADEPEQGENLAQRPDE